MSTGQVSAAELLKAGSRHLRGNIAGELEADGEAFGKAAAGLLKFHGIYQQDDRDLRRQRAEKQYSCMVRVGIAGGVVQAAQYLKLDELADRAGDGTLRITSRQDIQYHYVGKRSLRGLIQSVAGAGLSTYGACGDVVRNVTYDATPLARPGRGALVGLAQRVRKAFRPRSAAYAEIWLDGEKAASLEAEAEDVYGDTYLPRKFKIGFTHEGENLIDIYTNDLGFVAHSESGRLTGFTVLAGGGLGQSNGVKGSHPRLADAVCSIGPGEEEVMAVARAAVSIHRDFGNRENRRLARLKYVLDERGIEWFQGELSVRLGAALRPPAELVWGRQDDYLGWHEQEGGLWFYGLRVISGRLQGDLRRAVRAAVEATGCEVRLTAQQNLLLCGLGASGRGAVESVLAAHGVAPAGALPPVLRHSMACVSLPTCGQAITEAERVLPETAALIQRELDAAGAGGEVVHVRMTGCPNGCARPYTAEIGIVGETTGKYTIYLGGSPRGERLAQPWKKLVPLEAVGAELRPLFERWVQSRLAGEAFGDWWVRKG